MEDRLLHALVAWRAHPPTPQKTARLQDELAARTLADIQAIAPKPPAK